MNVEWVEPAGCLGVSAFKRQPYRAIYCRQRASDRLYVVYVGLDGGARQDRPMLGRAFDYATEARDYARSLSATTGLPVADYCIAPRIGGPGGLAA